MNQITTGDFAPVPVRRFLARLMTHSELGQAEQQAILKLSGQVAEMPARADIVRPNTRIAHAQLVTRGIVARFDEAKDGRRVATAVFVPGDLCGLQGVACPTTRWGLSAFTSCSVIHVPHDQLEKLVDAYPAVRRAFWREMAIDASIQAKWTANAIMKDSVSRAAHLLCEIGQRMQNAGACDRTKLSIKTSQDQLAQAVGLTVIHMNRVLRQLREEGLITTQTRTIAVSDWRGLCELANFDPEYLLSAVV